MGGPNGGNEGVAASITAVTSAYDDAAALIAGLDDADQAFAYATALWAALRVATDANGQLRALLAARIADDNGLDLNGLAARLSTPDRTMGKTRAGQLLQAGRALRARDT